MQRQRIKAGRGGGAHRQHAQAISAGKLGAGRGRYGSDSNVEHWIGVRPQVQPRLAQVPAIVFERDRFVAGQKLRNDGNAIFEQPARLTLLQPDHDAVGG